MECVCVHVFVCAFVCVYVWSLGVKSTVYVWAHPTRSTLTRSCSSYTRSTRVCVCVCVHLCVPVRVHVHVCVWAKVISSECVMGRIPC